MLKESVGTGSTIEEAQKIALEELNAPDNADVQIEVLELPVKKTLGIFGGTRAKVRAYYEEPENEKGTTVKKAEKQPQQQKAENKQNTQQKQVKEEMPQKSPAVAVSDDELEESIKKSVEYLKNIVMGMGIKNPDIQTTKVDEEYFINLNCDDDEGALIGRRGETLDSIQYLVRLVANRGKETEDYVRISVNVGNYREKRENTLKELAKKNASKVLKYGRNIALDPMNPFERRIIHTVVAEIEGVTSYSVGVDADRKVIIALKEGVRPTNPRNFNNNRGGGGYNRNNNRNDRNGGRNNNYHKNNNSRYNNNNSNNNNNYSRSNAPAQNRAPKSDAAGTSLYGRIEPK